MDSTNNYALTLVHAGLAQPGTAVFAHAQTAGKGQRGRSWYSEPGSSLSLSLILDPRPLDPTQQFGLSACMAVSACDFLNNYTNGGAKIKWPNDLYWQDRKAGGILIESVIGSGQSLSGNDTGAEWKWAVAGIGLNINQPMFGNSLLNPVSLTQITGRRFQPVELAHQLIPIIESNYVKLKDEGFDELFENLNARLYKLDQPARLKKGNIQFEGIIRGVTRAGRLLVEHGTLEEYSVGEISFVFG